MAENSDADQGPLSRSGIAPQPLFAVAAVLLGSFLANFDSRLTSVGLPDLRGAFSLGFDEGAWLSTAAIGSQIFIAPAVPGSRPPSACAACSAFRASFMP
jgi:MFS transporter, DHA2 family, multidrug resistance protein